MRGMTKVFHFIYLEWKWFPCWLNCKEPTCLFRRHKRHGLNPWIRKIPWSRKWQPTPKLLPGKSHGQRSLVGYSPWGRRVGHDWETSLTPSLKTISHWWKKLKSTQTDGKIYSILDRSISIVKMTILPRQSTHSVQFLSNHQWHFP